MLFFAVPVASSPATLGYSIITTTESAVLTRKGTFRPEARDIVRAAESAGWAHSEALNRALSACPMDALRTLHIPGVSPRKQLRGCAATAAGGNCGNTQPTVDHAHVKMTEEEAHASRSTEQQQRQQLHAYLGELEDVEHPVHSYFPEGAVVKLPLIYLPDIVLFPGDDLPLRMLSDTSIESIRDQLSSEGAVLGVLCPYQGDVVYGTTVRIEKFSVVDRCAAVTGAAKQRFRVKNPRQQNHSAYAEVEILPHPRPSRLPFAVCHLRKREDQDANDPTSAPAGQPQSQAAATKKRNAQDLSSPRLRGQQFTGYWGRHVYALYDVHELVRRIQSMFVSSTHWTWFAKASSAPNQQQQQQNIQEHSGSMLHYLMQPSEQQDPSIFAYWVAGNLPLDRKERLELLEIDCIVRLLRKEIEILGKFGDDIYCSGCGAFLAHIRDIFSMTSHGAAGTFVNPGGNVFQILTLREIHLDHVLIDVVRSTQDSWFPGYSWSIVYCNSCYRHLGWQFDREASESESPRLLSPARFFGFRRAALTQSFSGRRYAIGDSDSEDADDADDGIESLLSSVDYQDDDNDLD